MSNYRRRSKPKTEHIKKGFTVFQKTIATIASILGLITASITIMNAFDKDKDKKDTNPQTTIIKEIEKETSSPASTTATDTAASSSDTTAVETSASSSAADTAAGDTTTSSSAADTATNTQTEASN